MPVYLIIDLTVIDQDVYEEYMERVPAVVEQYGGRYLVRTGQVAALAGDWQPERIVVVEFDSSDQVQEFYASPEFQELAPLREQSTDSRIILVEGCDP
jgi:uncharacterized protein (DUF1330 family)